MSRAIMVKRLPRSVRERRQDDHGYAAAYIALHQALEAAELMVTNMRDDGDWVAEEDAHAVWRLLDQARKRMRLLAHTSQVEKKKFATTHI